MPEEAGISKANVCEDVKFYIMVLRHIHNVSILYYKN
jgi:hypothetical protein